MMMSKHAAIAALALCVMASGAMAQNMPPAEAFGSLPKFSSPRLSPDGKFIAAIQEFNGQAVVTIRPTEGGQPKGTVAPGMITTSIQWVKNDRLMFFSRATVRNMNFAEKTQTMYRAFTVDTNAEDITLMFAGARTLGINLTMSLTDITLSDPKHVLMPFTVDQDGGTYNPLRPESGQNYFRTDLMTVDIKDGKFSKSLSGTPDTVDFYTDGKGNVIGRRDLTRKPLLDKIFRLENGSWSLAGSFSNKGDDSSGIVGVAEDGKSLVQRLTTNTDGYVRFDLTKGATAESIFGLPQYDVTTAITDTWTGLIIGASYAAQKMEYRYFDPKRQALQKGIEQAFPGKIAHAVSESLDRSLAIVAVESPRQPETFYLLNRQTHMASEIAGTYPTLRETDLGEMKSYDYVARDGLNIPAFITLPPGRASKNLPAIVMPHGGPDARDTLGFDWWAQFLANRGYVVLQPNFRGSSGYGRKFTEAGLQQWGLKMQDDISDGVHKMIADGIVDPKRVCIVGASYGGYAALAGATFSPDLYACAASIAGISDLPDMLRQTKKNFGADSATVSFWYTRVGTTFDDSDQLRATSPARHADKVKIPILLMHGEKDTTVPIDQSEEMEAALKRAGKKVKFIRFPGDDHYLALAETRIKMLTELEAFLAEHIGEKKNAAN